MLGFLLVKIIAVCSSSDYFLFAFFLERGVNQSLLKFPIADEKLPFHNRRLTGA
jgi:hypothetical protein